MLTNLKKVALLSATGTMLTVAGGAQAANTLLFPFVTGASSTLTFVSVYDNPYSASGMAEAPIGNIGYRVSYAYKSVGATPQYKCEYREFDVTSKQGGLLQWEVAGRFDLPSDFGDDYTGDINSTANRLPNETQGFMIVEYTTPGASASTLHGDAIVIDTASGMVMSYAATSSTGTNFATGAGSESTSSWLPRSLSGTTWYVLPLGTRNEMVRANSMGISGKVVARTNVQQMGAYERNGQYYAGVKEQPFTCFGIFGIDDLLQNNHSAGGWLTMKTLTPSASNNSTASGDAQAAQVWRMVESQAIGVPITTMSPAETLR